MYTPTGKLIANGRNVKHAPFNAYDTYNLSRSEIEVTVAFLGVVPDRTIAVAEISGTIPSGSGSASDGHQANEDSMAKEGNKSGCEDIPLMPNKVVILHGAWMSSMYPNPCSGFPDTPSALIRVLYSLFMASTAVLSRRRTASLAILRRSVNSLAASALRFPLLIDET